VLHGNKTFKSLLLFFLLKSFFFRCKKWNVPIEKIYSKTQREKFRWAIDMATADYHFYNYKGEIVLRNVDETNNNDESDEDDEQNSDDE
jgi:hypothetical protein